MTDPIDQVVIGGEGRYLKPEEIGILKTYVLEWPQRQEVYTTIREREPELIQQTLVSLQQELPSLSPQVLQICQRDLTLTLRQTALAMLLQDEGLLKDRLIDWLEEQVRLYDLYSVYEAAFRSLQQVLKQQLTAAALEWIRPFVTQAQVALIF